MAMAKDEFTTCKIYRLVDLRYSPEHSNYVRYIGRTCREVEGRFQEHIQHSEIMMRYSSAGWFDFSELEVQLVESVGTWNGAKSREHFWIELHQKAGYNLLNAALMKGTIFPEGFLDPAAIREFIRSKIESMT